MTESDFPFFHNMGGSAQGRVGFSGFFLDEIIAGAAPG